MSATVYSLAILGDTVVIGGEFSFVGDQPRTALAAVDSDLRRAHLLGTPA